MRKITIISTAAFAAVSVLAMASSASAQVFNCPADGNRQRNGAIIGAVVGGVVGNNVSHDNSAPLVGALAGAAVGSHVGCQQQQERAANAQGRSWGPGNAVVSTNVNIRSRPSTRASRIGSLRAGDRINVIRYEGDWAVIGYRGRQTGYVSARYVRPE